MKLYEIEIDKYSWDEFRGFIVYAENEEEAYAVCGITETNTEEDYLIISNAMIKEIKLEELKEATIIMSDFNQG